jgi:hypothetical protein
MLELVRSVTELIHLMLMHRYTIPMSAVYFGRGIKNHDEFFADAVGFAIHIEMTIIREHIGKDLI